jgi:hypothetical protein
MNKPVVIVKKAVKTVSKPSKAAPAAKKAVLEKAPVEVVKKSKTVLIKPDLVIKAEEPAKAPKDGSKMAIATDIYLKMISSARKDVIAEFVDKAKLTSAGASTYFEILRKKHGKKYE